MIRVLAAEMSDPGRLSRGRQLWSDHAVVDIVVGHGAVTAEVQGSRPAPYVVTLETRSGLGTPSRGDVMVRCTCPDDDGTGRAACKHSVATLFALSDEVAVEPDVLARWRRSDQIAPHDTPDDDAPDDTPVDAPVDTPATRVVDELAGLLDAPQGTPLPPVPYPLGEALPPPADRLVAEVLHDALDHLQIRWE